ncbi:MAG TPA: HXXEE domain-containing protein [Anaerolineae bacterium]|nr:HXXEE domain-containing protein [Anaerolineae bacterium]
MDVVVSMILVLTAALLAHLVEEVATGFRAKLPLGEMPRPVFAGLNVLIYGYCFATFFLAARGQRLAVPLAWFLAVIMCLNGLGHIGIMVWRREYFPGGFTAFFVLVASLLLMVALANL